MQEFWVDSEQAFSDMQEMIESNDLVITRELGNTMFARLNGNVIKLVLDQPYVDRMKANKVSNIERVVYGKNTEENIVNISIRGNSVHVFKEVAGVVTETTTPYKHWVLSNKAYGGMQRLKGSQHFAFIKEYSDIESFNEVKSNIYKHGLYTIGNFAEAFMVRNGYTYFKGMRPDQVSLLSWDIETTGVNPNAADANVLLITTSFRKNGVINKRTFNVEDYESAGQMIQEFSFYVQELNPSLIIGHNIVMFDFPYINAIAERDGYGVHMGRDGSKIHISPKTKELRKDGSQSYTYNPVNIFGREIVDTFFLAIKTDIGRKYESYGLKAIVKHEGLEKEGRQHYDASKIAENWSNPEERAKIIQYAEDDADDPIKLFDIMVGSLFYLTQMVPKTFQQMMESATGSQINAMMVRSYLQDNFSVAKGDEKGAFEGAISRGNPGIYTNSVRIDVASLYPSIILTYDVAPSKKDYNGNLLRILRYLLEKRLTYKKLAKETGIRMYKDLDTVNKQLANSFYGFYSATGLNYNYPEGAAEITRRGREILTKAIEFTTSKPVGFTIPEENEEEQDDEGDL